MNGIHAIVTFLENRESLRGIDPEFRELVKFFHRIPFCASFGVSCAGHFRETNDTDDWNPDNFYPEPWGNLNIIVLPSIPHIQELLQILQKTISTSSDTSFKKIEHPFGPPENSQLEIWEIRIGDNGCFGSLKEEYHGGYLPIKDNKIAYEESKKRCREIRAFWKDLEREVADFCQRHGFKRFGLKKRIKEIVTIWKMEIKNK